MLFLFVGTAIGQKGDAGAPGLPGFAGLDGRAGLPGQDGVCSRLLHHLHNKPLTAGAAYIWVLIFY